MGLAMETGPALEYTLARVSTSQSLQALVRAPAYWFTGAGAPGASMMFGPQQAPAVVDAALATTAARPSIAVGNLGAIGVATNKQSFRQLLVSTISNPSHPLHELLNADGKLTTSTARGMNELAWFENPKIMEAGHYSSAKGLGGTPDRLVMMSAYENRLLSATLEHPSIGGEMLESGRVLSIGGVPVDFKTATALVEFGLLDADVFADAAVVIY